MFDRTEIKDRTVEKLSQAGQIIGCFVEDHLLFSSASAWKNGKQVWRVAHDGGEDGVSHLETSGDLPAELEGVRKNLFAQQEKEADALKVDHVYALPAELAKSLIGFGHDQDISGIWGDTFQILELKSGSLLDRLFGKKDKQ